MRGLNETQQAGNVSGPIKFGETTSGDSACSFMLAVDKGNLPTMWVRVNVYGALVGICEKKLRKGLYVIVTGELMNRQRANSVEGMNGFAHGETLTEIRARDVVFVDR